MDIVITADHLGEEGEAELVQWLADDGAAVAPGQPVAELETSKTIVEIVAPAGGVLAHAVEPGTMVELGAAIGSVRP